jgi:hypothetical protein
LRRYDESHKAEPPRPATRERWHGDAKTYVIFDGSGRSQRLIIKVRTPAAPSDYL